MFCMKCGNEIPEGAKFCIRCGNPVPDLTPKNPPENPVAENPAVKNPAPESAKAENPVMEKTVTESPIPENPKTGNLGAENPVPEDTRVENPTVTENPAPEDAKVENPAVSDNPAPENSATQEKPATVKSVIGEMGKKLESAKPVIDKMGEKLESAKPMINKMGEKLESAKPMIGEMGKKLESAKPMVGKIEEKLKIKPGKKKLPIIIGAVVFVLVIIMLLKGGGKGPGSGFGSPEEAYDAWMTGFWQHDFDLVLQAEPDFLIKYTGGEDKVREILQYNYENQVAPYVELGFVKFESAGHIMFEKDETKELEQKLEAAYGVNIKISAAAVIQQQAVSQTERKDAGTSGYALKYKGKWYYINLGTI